jgi:hypothetical protein
MNHAVAVLQAEAFLHVRFWPKADMTYCTAHVGFFDPKRTLITSGGRA